MKKIYMTMVAMLCGVVAMAQNELYADAIKANAGEEVELAIALRNEQPVTAVSFRLGLPEGVTMALNKKGKKYVTIDEDRMEEHTAILQTGSEGDDMISIYDINKAPFYENDGPIAYVPLAISEEVADGVYTVKIHHISISTPDMVSIASSTEATVELTVGKGTGINSINADDVNAPIYNVAGQRVSKAQKGVFIQNGKKVAVK